VCFLCEMQTWEKERLDKERMEMEMRQKEEKISKLERHIGRKDRFSVEDDSFPRSGMSREPVDTVPPIKHSRDFPLCVTNTNSSRHNCSYDMLTPIFRSFLFHKKK
jgi:hypothetical protein